MPQLLNERNSGFFLDLLEFEKDSNDWICFVAGLIVNGNVVYKTEPKDRRTMEKKEIRYFLFDFNRCLLKKEDFLFTPMEPEFTLSLRFCEDDDFECSFSIDCGREFKGIRLYSGDDLSFSSFYPKERLEEFIHLLDFQFHTLLDEKKASN